MLDDRRLPQRTGLSQIPSKDGLVIYSNKAQGFLKSPAKTASRPAQGFFKFPAKTAWLYIAKSRGLSKIPSKDGLAAWLYIATKPRAFSNSQQRRPHYIQQQSPGLSQISNKDGLAAWLYIAAKPRAFSTQQRRPRYIQQQIPGLSQIPSKDGLVIYSNKAQGFLKFPAAKPRAFSNSQQRRPRYIQQQIPGLSQIPSKDGLVIYSNKSQGFLKFPTKTASLYTATNPRAFSNSQQRRPRYIQQQIPGLSQIPSEDGLAVSLAKEHRASFLGSPVKAARVPKLKPLPPEAETRSPSCLPFFFLGLLTCKHWTSLSPSLLLVLFGDVGANFEHVIGPRRRSWDHLPLNLRLDRGAYDDR